MAGKMTAQVRVLRTDLTGNPVAEVRVDSRISAADLAALLQKVVTNEKILATACVPPCPACKSGLNVHIIDSAAEFINVEA